MLVFLTKVASSMIMIPAVKINKPNPAIVQVHDVGRGRLTVLEKQPEAGIGGYLSCWFWQAGLHVGHGIHHA